MLKSYWALIMNFSYLWWLWNKIWLILAFKILLSGAWNSLHTENDVTELGVTAYRMLKTLSYHSHRPRSQHKTQCLRCHFVRRKSNHHSSQLGINLWILQDQQTILTDNQTFHITITCGYHYFNAHTCHWDINSTFNRFQMRYIRSSIQRYYSFKHS